MDLSGWIFLAIVFAIIVLAVWRWKSVTRRRLTDDECRGLAEGLVANIFAVSSRPGDAIPLDPASVRSLGAYEMIDLARWMNGHGYVTTGEWGWKDILMGQPPYAMALTQREYDKALAKEHATNVIHGNGNINNNYGEIQVVAEGDVRIDSDSLRELVDAIRQDAMKLGNLERNEALAAADAVADAAQGALEQESPRFQGAVRWLFERLEQVATGALGSGLWVATAAVLNRLGS